MSQYIRFNPQTKLRNWYVRWTLCAATNSTEGLRDWYCDKWIESGPYRVGLTIPPTRVSRRQLRVRKIIMFRLAVHVLLRLMRSPRRCIFKRKRTEERRLPAPLSGFGSLAALLGVEHNVRLMGKAIHNFSHILSWRFAATRVLFCLKTKPTEDWQSEDAPWPRDSQYEW